MGLFKTLLIGGLATFSVVLTSLTFSPTAAAAASTQTISCGAIACSVDTTAYGQSGWTDTGSSGSGGSTPTYSSSQFIPCSLWLGKTTGITGSYPVKNSGSYACGFFAGKTITPCPPQTDRASTGKIEIYQTGSDNKQHYLYYFCLYPTDAYAPIKHNLGNGKIYTSGIGNFFNTNSSSAAAATYGAGGRLTSSSGWITRNVNLSNPAHYVGAWKPAFTAKTGINANGDPQYGYYRLQWTLNYRLCEKYGYPAWLNQPVQYDCSQKGQDKVASPYTYACNIGNPPLRAGIIRGASFIPNVCNPKWKCIITGSTKVNNYFTPITVMRNGEKLNVTYPSVGVSGSAIRDSHSWKIYNQVTAGATPTINFVYTSWKWDSYVPYQKTGNTIAFTWASDTINQPFSWSTKYSFTAEWYMPTTANIGGSTKYKWVTASATCPQTTYSPKVTVVRSVNR